MNSSSENPFLLSKFFNKQTFPLQLNYDNFTYCFEPIVELVNFFSSLSPSKNNFSLFPQCAFKNAESIYIEENVEIDPFVFIEGPVWISKGAKIKHGAYLRPFTFIGKNAIVGHASEIKRSILCENAKAAHFNYVGDSILGFNVNLGAGVKCANYKLDKGMIKLRTATEKIQTGQKKLGAIIGDESAIGCNTVLSPGTLISPCTKIPPSAHVKGTC